MRVYVKKDAIVGKPGLRIVVKNLPEDSFAYALKNLFYLLLYLLCLLFLKPYVGKMKLNHT